MKKNSQKQIVVFGTSPVSSRGQVVIPAKLRKSHNIQPGETLIFTGTPGANYFHVLNASSFKGFTRDLQELLTQETKQKRKPAKPETDKNRATEN